MYLKWGSFQTQGTCFLHVHSPPFLLLFSAPAPAPGPTGSPWPGSGQAGGEALVLGPSPLLQPGRGRDC